MATYKVIQDIEAEDKLVGPLTLRQFIYACIAALCLYLSFLAITKHAAFMIVLFLPIAVTTGFFAFPWGQDQPTEVWALAKIRFLMKPRRRIWDQSGAKELVTITAPKMVDHVFTNGLSQDEVRSRLAALASTIDSRGWAVKNVNVNLEAPMVSPGYASDRLVPASSLPQEVNSVDVRASDDMLDEHSNPVAQHFDSMIAAASTAHHQQLMAQMQQPTPAPMSSASAAAAATPMPVSTPVAVGTQPQQQPADYWFMHPAATVPGQATFADTPVIVPGAQTVTASAPQAAMPTADEEALVSKLRAENGSQTVAYGHMKMVKTPQQLAAEEAAQRAAAAAAATSKPPVTPKEQAVIMSLANNDDLDVATIARQAQQAKQDDGEVVISLR